MKPLARQQLQQQQHQAHAPPEPAHAPLASAAACGTRRRCCSGKRTGGQGAGQRREQAGSLCAAVPPALCPCKGGAHVYTDRCRGPPCKYMSYAYTQLTWLQLEDAHDGPLERPPSCATSRMYPPGPHPNSTPPPPLPASHGCVVQDVRSCPRPNSTSQTKERLV